MKNILIEMKHQLITTRQRQLKALSREKIKNETEWEKNKNFEQNL